MTPTSVRLLVLTALVGVVVGTVGAAVWKVITDAPPVVPWTAPLVLGVLAAGFALAAVTLRPRIQRREGHRPLDPFVAARTAVLAVASSRAGAAVAGVYLGYAVYLVADVEHSVGDNPFRRRQLIATLVAALAGAALSAAALWLERSCRVKDGDDDEGGGAPAAA